MTLPARVLVRLGAVAALTLALAVVGVANAGGDRHVARPAAFSVPAGAGNPCYPLHDYASAACDRAWQAYVATKRAARAAAVAKPAPTAPCTPLHDYKFGKC